jgi:DNA-binding CsgD family transcriptional regulator
MEVMMFDVALAVRGFHECSTIDELKGALSVVLRSYGLTQFVYLRWSNDLLSVEESIHTYSTAWTERYVAKGYSDVDPVVGMAHASSAPFLWDAESLSRTGEIREFFNEAEKYGLYSGVTIPLKTPPSKRIFVTFASPKGSRAYASARIDAGFIPTMKFIALQFHSSVLRMRGNIKVILTAREIEVLRLFSAGLNAVEVSHVLGLTADTVSETSARASRKMGQENRTAACALACRMMGDTL